MWCKSSAVIASMALHALRAQGASAHLHLPVAVFKLDFAALEIHQQRAA
jgi:hypothetical protein